MALQRGATFRELPGIEHGCAYAHEGRFEVNEMNGTMGENKATRSVYSMAIVARAIILRFNVGASSQRKVDDVVQKPASISHTLENAPHTLQPYALGILIVKTPQTPVNSLPLTYESLEFLLTLTTCFIWPSTPFICSCSSSLALLFLSAFSWIS